MNPLTNVKNINKLNEVELSTGLIHKKSWHDMYKGSAWIFIGGLEYGLTEGDVITVFSQYGEVVNINLVRDKKSGKSKGYCFLCFANQKSTVLAVDNLNGIKLCNRTIRVDHVADYKPPKEDERDDEITKMLKTEGCAPKPALPNESSVPTNPDFQIKKKKSKKEKKKKKKKRKHDSDENNSENGNSGFPEVKVKREKHDAGYDKYDTSLNASHSRADKRIHQGSRFEDSGNERSRSWDRVKPNQDQMPQNVRERSSRHEDQYVGSHRSKERYRYENERRDKYKEFGKDDAYLTKDIKRERSSSSEGSPKKHRKDVRHGTERSKLKSKDFDSKRREKYSSSSSSSDQDSSSQSSSEDERNRTESRNSKRDQLKNYNERKEESRCDYRHVPRSKTDEFASSSKKHYDARERDSEYNSKDRYRSNDRHDSHSRDSYSKYKYDKR